MKKSILIVALTLLAVLSAHANDVQMNCESFETIRMKDCIATVYDESDEAWSATIIHNIERIFEKIGNGENSFVRETTHNSSSTSIDEFGTTRRLVTTDPYIDSISSKWIECSPTSITTHTSEVVTHWGYFQVIYNLKHVMNVIGDKVVIKEYYSGHYHNLNTGNTTMESDAFHGRPRNKLECSLF